MESTGDIGWHVSWTGANLERFNNMPLLEDDDDGTTSCASPPTGCASCIDGLKPLCTPGLDGDCTCNAQLVADNYICPFRRWDIFTDFFGEVDMSQTNRPNQRTIRYQGTSR